MRVNNTGQIMKVKLVARVHSDRDIEYPQGYFNATVSGFAKYWNLVEVDGRRMVMESVERELGWTHSAEDVFKNITPQIFESASVEVVAV